jgi:hypothetical protein
MKKLPQGEWVLSAPVNSTSRRNTIVAKEVPIARITKLLEQDQSEAMILLILGLRNALPTIVIDMAKYIALSKILTIARDIANEGQASELNDVEFAAFLVEAVEALRRAESVIPRERGERTIDWIDRVVYKLQILDGLEKGNF